MHRPARLVATMCLLAFCTAAIAGEVYQWKDAKGVTQYTSTPPAKGAYKVRTIQGEAPAAEAPVAAKPAEDPACAIARKNVALLQGKAAVQVDSNGDGKPDKTLSDEDRADQMQLAQATLKVNCASADAATAR